MKEKKTPISFMEKNINHHMLFIIKYTLIKQI